MTQDKFSKFMIDLNKLDVDEQNAKFCLLTNLDKQIK